MPCPLPKTRVRAPRAPDDDVAKLYHQIKPVTGQRNPRATPRGRSPTTDPKPRGTPRTSPAACTSAPSTRACGAGPCRRRAARWRWATTARPGDYAQRGAGRLVAPLGRARLGDRARGRHGPAQRRGWGLEPGQSARKGEIAVFREDLGFGAAALVPGEGVWFEESSTRSTGPPVLRSTVPPIPLTKSATPSDGPPSAPAAPAAPRA